MPFDVKELDGTLIEITTNAKMTEFFGLTLQRCHPTEASRYYITDCFDYVYPLCVVDSYGYYYTIDSEYNFIYYFEEKGWDVDFVFPLYIVMDGSYDCETISTVYELLNLLENECSSDDDLPW